MVRISESVYVSLAYRYWNGAWNAEKNREAFGAWASEEGMGGNWRIDVTILAPSDDELQARRELAGALAIAKSELDHRCLWQDIEEFRVKPSTPENVAAYLSARALDRAPSVGRWGGLTVHESERLAFTAPSGTLASRVMNLTLFTQGPVDPELGLALPRELVTRVVKEAFAANASDREADEGAWGRALLARLAKQVKGLEELRIDLGRHKYLLVKSVP